MYYFLNFILILCYKYYSCFQLNKNATTHEKTSILAEKISENKKDIFEQNNNLICKEEKCLNYVSIILIIKLLLSTIFVGKVRDASRNFEEVL